MTVGNTFEAEFARFKHSPNEFSSDAFDRNDRLGAMETYVYGPRAQDAADPLFTSLSLSNENYVKHERVVGNDIVVSRTTTSGFFARSGKMLTDAVMINTCLSGEASVGSDHFRQDDIYINLSEVRQRQFSPGVYQRLVFPSRRLMVGNVKNKQLLIFRRDSPVTTIIRSAVDGVEDAIAQGDKSRIQTLEDVMVSVTQRILEHALLNQSNDGYDHLRDRAIAYIRDNLHRADLSVSEIAKFVGVARATLYRAFESVGGIKHFVSVERISRAKSMLKLGTLNRGHISAVAYTTGFVSPEQFSKVFKAQTGLTPTQFIAAL